jgi:hypothetical protein
MIESMLTLGDKYDISHVRQEALGQFESAFPRKFHLVATPDYPATGFEVDDYGSICDVVALAKKFDIETSLPALYYHILIQENFPVRSVMIKLNEHFLLTTVPHVGHSAHWRTALGAERSELLRQGHSSCACQRKGPCLRRNGKAPISLALGR